MEPQSTLRNSRGLNAINFGTQEFKNYLSFILGGHEFHFHFVSRWPFSYLVMEQGKCDIQMITIERTQGEVIKITLI